MTAKQKKAMQSAVNEICEVRAIYSTKQKTGVFVNSAAECLSVLRPFYDSLGVMEQKEVFSCILIKRSGELLGVVKISEGSAVGCVVDIQYMARLAILTNAQAIIMCHNHPSGALKASSADKDVTRKTKEGLKLLDVQMHDHIIITAGGYLSFAEECLF